jgi:DNA-binding GntR family transcriptional regulator
MVSAVPTLSSPVDDPFAGIALPKHVREGRGVEPLVDEVYRTLRDAIFDGRLQPDQRLTQIPLSEHLGISRTPVREALLRLSQEGLVRAVSFRGFAVSPTSSREIFDVYAVRLPLELAGARPAVGKHTAAQLAELRANCEATRRATSAASVAEVFDLNRAFHMGLIAPCENQILIRMLDQLWSLPSSLRVLHQQIAVEDNTVLRRSIVEHEAILEALEAKDVELVAERLTAHLEGALAEAERRRVDRSDA